MLLTKPTQTHPTLEEDTMDLLLTKYLELRNSEEGQTMAEYGLLLALIAVVVVAAILVLGPAIANIFNDIAENLS